MKECPIPNTQTKHLEVRQTLNTSMLAMDNRPKHPKPIEFKHAKHMAIIDMHSYVCMLDTTIYFNVYTVKEFGFNISKVIQGCKFASLIIAYNDCAQP